jgi:cyclic pyranopterin phosphate synthase
MGEEGVPFRPHGDILTYEEIVQFVKAVVPLGIDKIRITGGEPLVRNGLPSLVEQIAQVDGITDLAMTTNGILLPKHAAALKAAGLKRLNVSLDAMSEETFQTITRRSGVHRVTEGIQAALDAGFPAASIRINSVPIRGINEHEIVPLVEFGREQGLQVRFIEFMPLDAQDNWQQGRVVAGEDIRRMLEAAFGPLEPMAGASPHQPAVDYRFGDGVGSVGLINSVEQPFCENCNRLRLTADGKVRNCLFSHTDWDVRSLLRSGSTDEQIVGRVRECILAKQAGHEIDSADFQKPDRPMHQIGG